MNTKNTIIDKLFNEITKFNENLKGEIVLAEILKKTPLTFEDFIVRNNSTFNRSYRRDVLKFDIKNYTDIIEMNLSRNGLYDHLPEGIFHNYQPHTKQLTYSALRKQQKKEEKNARQFFTPIENEFFFQKLNIEITEQQLLDNFINLNEDFLIKFWKIDSKAPKKYVRKFLRILPYCSTIVGNIELTQLALEMILEETVTIKKTLQKKETIKKTKKQTNYTLGIDFTLDNNEENYLFPTLEVTIGPVKNERLYDYFSNNEGLKHFVSIFYDYTIPLDYEVKTQYKAVHEKNFTLNSKKPPILGVSTAI